MTLSLQKAALFVCKDYKVYQLEKKRQFREFECVGKTREHVFCFFFRFLISSFHSSHECKPAKMYVIKKIMNFDLRDMWDTRAHFATSQSYAGLANTRREAEEKILQLYVSYCKIPQEYPDECHLPRFLIEHVSVTDPMIDDVWLYDENVKPTLSPFRINTADASFLKNEVNDPDWREYLEAFFQDDEPYQ